MKKILATLALGATLSAQQATVGSIDWVVACTPYQPTVTMQADVADIRQGGIAMGTQFTVVVGQRGATCNDRVANGVNIRMAYVGPRTGINHRFYYPLFAVGQGTLLNAHPAAVVLLAPPMPGSATLNAVTIQVPWNPALWGTQWAAQGFIADAGILRLGHSHYVQVTY